MSNQLEKVPRTFPMSNQLEKVPRTFPMSNQLEKVPRTLPKLKLNQTMFEILGNVLLK
jgi:hypothetical protein